MDALPTYSMAEIEEKVRTHLDRAAFEVIETGRWLALAKQELKHGQLKPWLEEKFSLSERMAEHCINAWRTFGENPKRVSDLPARVIFQLSAPSTPQAVRDEVLDLKATGKTITASVVKDKINEAKGQKPPETKVDQDREAARKNADALKTKRATAEERWKRAAEAQKEEPEDDSAEAQWQRSANALAQGAGHAIAVIAQWDRDFDKQWRTWDAPTNIIELAEQAASTWAEVARVLQTANRG
jgi:hypothetical protein